MSLLLDNCPELANSFGPEPAWLNSFTNKGGQAPETTPQKVTLDHAAAAAVGSQARKELSIMQFAMERVNDPMLLTMLLSSRTQIALQPNIMGDSALSVAIRLGVRRPVQLLLGAMLASNFSQTAGSLEVLASSFLELSDKYPQARALAIPCSVRPNCCALASFALRRQPNLRTAQITAQIPSNPQEFLHLTATLTLTLTRRSFCMPFNTSSCSPRRRCWARPQVPMSASQAPR